MTEREESHHLRRSGFKRSECFYCQEEIGLLKRKRRCKMCGELCCSDCCSTKANYPISYGFTSAKWACNTCMVELFEKRTEEVLDSPKLERKKVAALIDGSYHTCEDGNVHTAFKMADPVCRMFFRMSGMYDGGKFDRSTLQKAMRINKAVAKLTPVGDVTRHYIPVPKVVLEEKWKIEKMYKRPPFIPRVKKCSSEKQTRRKKRRLSESVEKTKDTSLRSSSSSVVKVEEDSKRWSEISVFVYQPKNRAEDEKLPVVVCIFHLLFNMKCQ